MHMLSRFHGEQRLVLHISFSWPFKTMLVDLPEYFICGNLYQKGNKDYLSLVFCLPCWFHRTVFSCLPFWIVTVNWVEKGCLEGSLGIKLFVFSDLGRGTPNNSALTHSK